MSRVVGVIRPLAEKTKEIVESLSVGKSFGLGSAQSPFADEGRRVAGLFADFRNGEGRVRNGALPFQCRISFHGLEIPDRTSFIPFVVAPYIRMSAVFACHQGITGRCAHR